MKILEYLQTSSNKRLETFFPFTEVIKISANIMCANKKRYRHKGKVIKQEFLYEIFGNHTPLNSFNWQDIVEVQTELWKRGVGINAKADTWGPKNWGKTEGNKLKLVDTSHLCCEKKEIKLMLKQEVIEQRRRRLIEPVVIQKH